MLNIDAIIELSEFNVHQWTEWIENEITGIHNEIRLPLSDIEIDERLIIIYKNFEKRPVSRNNLIRASVALLSQFSQTKTNLNGIYYLLQFIGFTRPEIFVTQLEIILKRELLKDLNYEEMNLHHILLNELVNFTNVEKLHEYFYEKIAKNGDIAIKLIGLKYFYRMEDSKNYFKYLEAIVSSEKYSDHKKRQIISTEIVESFSEFGYYTKNYCELYRWIQNFWPRMENSSSSFRDFLNDDILNWLHDENSVIKVERNKCAIGIKQFISEIVLANEPDIDVFLDFSNIESYSFPEYLQRVRDLPPIGKALKSFDKKILQNNNYSDSVKFSKFILMASQYSMCAVLDPEKLKNSVEEFSLEIGNQN